MRLDTRSVAGAKHETTSIVSDDFIHEIWTKLEGQVTREKIYRIATEVANEFKDARVTIFLPILIRRGTLERLEATNQDGRASEQ